MFSTLRSLAVFFAFALATVAQAAALPAGVTQGPTVEGITQYQLKNGLTVLLFPDATKPVTTVNVTYLVGSRQENYGETGMAHLLEHMLFKGTPSIKSVFTELGRRGMQFNGSTFFDRTNYHETFPASEESLAWALRMESERMTTTRIRRSARARTSRTCRSRSFALITGCITSRITPCWWSPGNSIPSVRWP